MQNRRLALGILVAAAFSSLSASGAVVSIDASVQGLWTSFGQNNKAYNAAPGNILCGRNNVSIFRNYFVFNLPANLVPAGQQILAAEMVGKLPWRGYLSSDATETWTLFDVNPANYAVLVNEGASIENRVDVFNDLGTGKDYGTRVMSVADEPAPNTVPGQVVVPLTKPAFLTDLASRLSAGSIAIGGSITTLTGTTLQIVFGFTGYDSSNGGRATLKLTIGAPPCVGDLNKDAVVDDLDFQIFVVAYDILDCAEPSMPSGCPSDLNRDGVVDDLDFQVFVVAYNALLCP
ncbi:MAG: hypothetical protein K2Y21_09280 [Phycisphaerales bacterium]|nr:hypothetical protein [Phycisphaerales bacterium]